MFYPTKDCRTKLVRLCQDHHLEYEFDEQCLRVRVNSNEVRIFLLSLYGELEGPELANTKVTTNMGQPPSLSDIARIIHLDILIHRYNSLWIVDSIEAERYESHFQPIVMASDCREGAKPFAHEALFRIRDDSNTIVPPAHVFKLADSSDLLFSLDQVARRSAVTAAAKAKLPGKVFINFNPNIIYDPATCLRETSKAINELGLKSNDIVFEITETHRVRSDAVLKGILNFYRDAGFEVALDDIGSGWSGLNMLHKIKPDYVKIDMELVRDIDQDNYKQSIVEHLIKLSHQNGAKVIAEGIENEKEAKWLCDAQVDFMQGFYFAKPAPVL